MQVNPLILGDLMHLNLHLKGGVLQLSDTEGTLIQNAAKVVSFFIFLFLNTTGGP